MWCHLSEQFIYDVHSSPFRVQRQQFQTIWSIILFAYFFLLFLWKVEVINVLAVVEGRPSIWETLWNDMLVYDTVEESRRKNRIIYFDRVSVEIIDYKFFIFGVVVVLAQIEEDLSDCMVFFLHFLMVASALLGLPGAYKNGHCLEYFIHPPHMLIQKVMVVNFQEPMVPLVLLKDPVPESLVRIPYFLSSSAPWFRSLAWWFFCHLFRKVRSRRGQIKMSGIGGLTYFVLFLNKILIQDGRVLGEESLHEWELTLLNHWL